MLYIFWAENFATITTSTFWSFPVQNILQSGTYSGMYESQNSQQWRIILKTLDSIVLLYIYVLKSKGKRVKGGSSYAIINKID